MPGSVLECARVRGDSSPNNLGFYCSVDVNSTAINQGDRSMVTTILFIV